MVGTLATIIGLSTLVFAIIMSLAGVFDILSLGVVVVVFNLIVTCAGSFRYLVAIWTTTSTPKSSGF